MKLTYLNGDATKPQGEGLKIIVHVCNNVGAWGAGFVLALSKKWPITEAMYRSIPIQELKLGNVQFVSVESNIMVANMIGQHGVGYDSEGNPPIRYDAIRTALLYVNAIAVNTNATIHAPRFGAGLAGGDWNEIEKIIKEVITVDMFVYDFN